MTYSAERPPRRRGSAGYRRLAVLVYSSVFIAVSAASVAVTTMALAGFPLRVEPPFVVFAATLLVYSLNRFADREEDARNVPGRVAFVRRYGRYSVAAGVLLYVCAAGIVFVQLPSLAAVLLLPLVVIALYSIVGLKRVLLVKNLLVGLSWGVIPLGVGVYLGDPWRVEVGVLVAWVTAMLTVAAMVFDVKDVEGDRAAGIRTVPNVYGLTRTRHLAHGANGIVAAAVVGLVALGVVPTEWLVLLGQHLYVGWYVQAARPDRGPLFYGLVIDGEHVVLAALALAVT